MSHFSDLLNDARTWQSSTEKRRALKGIEEMIKVGKSHVRSALPQIYACLQSALSNDELRSTAFQAWGTMIRSLDDEEVADMLESTFSTIIQQWQRFDDSTKKYAQELIEYILDKRFQTLGLNADRLPSLAQIPELLPCQRRLDKMRSKSDTRQQYIIFCERIAHEHSSVVIQGLTELTIFLRKNQDFLQASAASEQPDKVVGELLRTILDVCVKFNGSNVDIARLSAECIGLIGCLDPNRVEAVRERNEFVVVSNFDDAGDTTNFALFILEEVLVKAFLSATNPRYQGFFSYVMQELLLKCDFSIVVAAHGRNSDHTDEAEALYQKWNNLPDSVQMTLTPFLSSKYTITALPITVVEYPIFQPNKNYNVWLRTFVLDLLQKPHNPNAILLFDPLCRVIKIEDTSVANFLLPYVVLHSVVLGSDLDRNNILEEIMRILAHDAPADTHHELNNVKLCSEVSIISSVV
jgi:serine/threonine-protein kinase ATR